MLPTLLFTISLSVSGSSESPEITSPQTGGDYSIYGAERDREAPDPNLRACCWARYTALGCFGVGNNEIKQKACIASYNDCIDAGNCK